MALDAATINQSHYLFPGSSFASKESVHVTTVLGSCISVCLWDRVLEAGGINHYLLPMWNGEGLPTPRYGNVAIENLIEKMFQMGSVRRNLVAKVFGGASMWQSNSGLIAVGERNISLAHSLLKEHQIPIVSTDVGGDRGRKIIFSTKTGNVMLRRHQKDLAPSDDLLKGFCPLV